MIPLLEVKNLSVRFGNFEAISGCHLEIAPGASVGIIGASGSGKTALVHAIAGISKGEVRGEILFQRKKKIQLGLDIGMVFQDPMTYLNPTMKIGSQIAEGMLYHRLISKNEARAKVIELLQLVGIPNPEMRFGQYPHELSGGQRQRVLIAIAIACGPKLLIADEPTTALDIMTQMEILKLIQNLQKQLNMALLMISHDMRVITSMCASIFSMKNGMFEKYVSDEKTQKNLSGRQELIYSR